MTSAKRVPENNDVFLTYYLPSDINEIFDDYKKSLGWTKKVIHSFVLVQMKPENVRGIVDNIRSLESETVIESGLGIVLPKPKNLVRIQAVFPEDMRPTLDALKSEFQETGISLSEAFRYVMEGLLKEFDRQRKEEENGTI